MFFRGLNILRPSFLPSCKQTSDIFPVYIRTKMLLRVLQVTLDPKGTPEPESTALSAGKLLFFQTQLG